MKINKIINVLLCGVGGQGVLTMAEALCLAATFEGFHVKKSEVHGMAQRGGSVESHVRFGQSVLSPLIPFGEADYLVCLHPDEHVRLRGFLKKGGADLFDFVDKIKKMIPSAKYLNAAMLGVLAAKLGFSMQSWDKTFEQMFANKNLAENMAVFRKAYLTARARGKL
jgi:indolepyruvate ferredoxin oxidoreductase, beta subunit